MSECPSVIDAFLDLSLQPVDVSSETLDGIESFLVVMYSRTYSASGVRKELFAHGSRTMEPNKPTKTALRRGKTTRGIASGVCVVTGACSGPCPA